MTRKFIPITRKVGSRILPGIVLTACTLSSSFSQKPPSVPDSNKIIDSGSVPIVFIQEGVTPPSHQSAATFMPDGNTVYLASNDTTYFSKRVDGKWTKPVIAPFSRQWHNWDPTLSPDGKKLVFVSDRPSGEAPRDQTQSGDHLWYVDRLSGDEWSAPTHLDSPINLAGLSNYGPSISALGTICFCSKGRDGNKGMCGYTARRVGNHYDKPTLLSLNGANDVYDPFIAPDESYIIFASGKDLYISYRRDNTWTTGQKLALEVNNGNVNRDPYVSPDGKTLYYAQSHAKGIMMVRINLPSPAPVNITEAGAMPTLFAPGVVSTPEGEFAPSFVPDGKTVYFTGGSDDSSVIYFSKKSKGRWTSPKKAAFSGHWKDMDPFVSSNGKRLYFSSYRPLKGSPQDQPHKNAHIWYVEYLSPGKWSTPRHLEAPINLEGINNYAPSVSRSGTLCFFSPARDSNNRGKSYYARWSGDHYEEPKVLSLNGYNSVRDPFISADERYIIFVSGNDFYISYRSGSDWSPCRKLAPPINQGGKNYSPYVSPDGKIFFYSAVSTPGIQMIRVNI